MTSESEIDPKVKFREALDKKKASNRPNASSKSRDSKVRGGQNGAGAPKMFRRKSGAS